MWRYIHTNELYHHGVKGMKWGVRRYQRKDGTLTPAGKKKYYTDQGWLNDEGRKQRDANSYKIYEKALEIRKKISKSDEYKKAASELKESLRENEKEYKKARQSWLDGTDFKKADYYTFKDLAYGRWIESSAGQLEAKRQKKLRSVIEKQVRETIGEKAFNQTLPELNASPWTKNLGKDYCDRILNIERYSKD